MESASIIPREVQACVAKNVMKFPRTTPWITLEGNGGFDIHENKA